MIYPLDWLRMGYNISYSENLDRVIIEKYVEYEADSHVNNEENQGSLPVYHSNFWKCMFTLYKSNRVFLCVYDQPLDCHGSTLQKCFSLYRKGTSTTLSKDIFPRKNYPRPFFSFFSIKLQFKVKGRLPPPSLLLKCS